mmetsp:Transcript_16986/g.40014  ORF Transcript_16986/g.40014 Transcript_16986/m.40014 type:complete len:806 (-) Transcript_16986:148-2565(-)
MSKNSGGAKSGKKVGFASNTTTFDIPSNSNYQSNQSSTSSMGGTSNNWDTETDHMLSYFLEGDGGLHSAVGMPEFSHPESTSGTGDNATSHQIAMGTAGAPSSSTAQHSLTMPQHLVPFPPQDYHQPATHPQHQAHQYPTQQPHFQIQPPSRDNEQMAPPTPKAPQYYASRQTSSPKSKPPIKSSSSGDLSQQNPQSAVPSSASSSSSSLSTMANTLVPGGQMLVQQMQQQMQQQQQMYASMMAAAAHYPPPPHQMQGIPSPVSPAAMIGTPENMMLPPPPPPAPAMMGQAYRSAAAEAAAANSNSTPPAIFPAAPPPTNHPQMGPPPPTADYAAQQQAHLAWIRHLNDMARAAGTDQSARPQPSGPREAAEANPQLHHPQPPPAMMHPPGASTTAPAAVHPPPHQFGMPYSPYPHLTFYGHAAAAAAAALQQNKNPPEESEEKKKQRLERNRESARKSRRRKKERLVEAESQVNSMHRKIANERERQIEKIVPGLRKLRNQQIESFVTANMESSSCQGALDPAVVMTCVRETGPSSPIFRSVLEFQGTSMHASLLPRYQKLWLWLALNEEAYFSAGKEEYVKRDPDRMVVRTSSGKISSKQVGDELMNGPPPEAGSKRSAAASKPRVDLGTVDRTSRTNDASRMWPLFCYEHQFSVDQEEKFLNLHKKIRFKHSIEEAWDKSQAAMKAASSLRDAMESVCHVASNREERTLVGVLTMDQILKYRQWTVMNHERCTRSMHQAYPPQQQQLPIDTSNFQDFAMEASDGGRDSNSMAATSLESRPRESLQDICQRLERVLRISKSGN